MCDRYGDNGGAYLFNVRVDAVDDLVDDDNLLICISDKSSDCVDKNSQFFRPYSLGASKYMEIQGTKVYDGKPITLFCDENDYLRFQIGDYGKVKFSGEMLLKFEKNNNV